ncbi:MAG: helix-turn-helix transcriptional regulator [Gammaproteobacteria bacterium]|nr:MAG: helix-turn-helix transcriptional regulator [Gammaproteobacteria bacterium]
MLNEYLTTKELAELLRVKERKVYDLVASGEVPCTRATGKLLFPRKAIDEWLASNVTQPAMPARRPLIMVGSHDPLLEWALRASRCGLASYFDSSLDGLDRFADREGIATGLHVYDAVTDSWNKAAVETRFGHSPVVLVEWARRARGIIVRTQTQGEYTDLGSLSGKAVVPRQAGAGSQILLESLLQQRQIDPASVNWTTAAPSEVDAVIEVVEGRADATFGLAMLASQHRLGFVPVVDERYDVLVDRREWFEPTWQSLIGFCRGAEFRSYAEELAGYDIGGQFDVHFNGAG